jgi:hypothetical protein
MAFANVFLHHETTPLAVPGVAFTDGAMEHVSPDADAEFLCGETVTLVAQPSSGANLPDCGAVFEVFTAGDELIHVGYAPFVAGVATYVLPAGLVCPGNSYEWRAGVEIDGVRCAYSSKRGFVIGDVYRDGLTFNRTLTLASVNAFVAFVNAAYPDEMRIICDDRSLSFDGGYLLAYSAQFRWEYYYEGDWYAGGDLWLALYVLDGYCYWANGDDGSNICPDHMSPLQWACAPIASGFRFVPCGTYFSYFWEQWPAAKPPDIFGDTSAWLEIA